MKKEGKITNSPSQATDYANAPKTALDKLQRERDRLRESASVDQYNVKISKKLGINKKLLKDFGDDDDISTTSSAANEDMVDYLPTENDVDDEEAEMLEAVERALIRRQEEEAKSAPKPVIVDEMEVLAKKMEEENKQQRTQLAQQDNNAENVELKKTSSGIGGSWAKNETSQAESYRPANGGWGYFPRPKDISKAYGGGKKIGANVKTTYEDELRKEKAIEDTRDKLRNYREKVGIDVQSEKDHAKEIEEALLLGQRAMQRGIYGTAVSALEKVTKWCSTNSKVGGQVFLELAMAYEAVGRTDEAIQVYKTLSVSRMEDVKYNAKRLKYGIEAMQFMRDEAKSEAFSRKKASQTFIDTTGLGNIAENFDDVYNTAYIDLDRKGGFYRELSKNVVRSYREARQILLAATDASEVNRAKIVQALRSLDRNFIDALRNEIKRTAPKPKTVAVMNGVPIESKDEEEEPSSPGTFNLGDIDQTLENIEGNWKLQLIADNQGNGVNFFNKTLCWQNFDTTEMSYEASGPSGFLTLSQKGSFVIDEVQRIITRKEVEKEGSAAFFTDVYSSNLSGPTAAVNLQQQIVSIDSELLVTRTVLPKEKLSGTVKGYFSVWRQHSRN